MSSLDRFAEFFVAVVFFCAGVSRIFPYKQKETRTVTEKAHGFARLPYKLQFVVAVFEIAAAFALLVPVDPAMHIDLARLAAAGLALLTIAASIYRVRHNQSAAPTIALFFMAMFVMIGRWP
jgi:Na+/H+ antiporter NhaD/arsenite permease-like protein